MQVGRKFISFIMVLAIALAPLAGTASNIAPAGTVLNTTVERMAEPCSKHMEQPGQAVQDRQDAVPHNCCCDQPDDKGCKGGGCKHQCMHHLTSPAIVAVPAPPLDTDIHVWQLGLDDATQSWQSPPFTKPPQYLR